jgi:hypothetical protein
MTRALYLCIFLFFTLTVSAKSADTLNRVNAQGQRTGWWVLDKHNNPVYAENGPKAKEGSYIRGRKFGAWINYYEDGATPRLIGEYEDNRPAGSFFRFDREGNIIQASTVSWKLPFSNMVQTSNAIFSCRLMFESKEPVAGQVFFKDHVKQKGFATRFWMEAALKTETYKSSEVNYDWLSATYPQILLNYMEIRDPMKKKLSSALAEDGTAAVKTESARPAKVRSTYYYPPLVKDPIVAPGQTFKRNGLNKLYSKDSEIWIDGYFRDGRLENGKVFIYDRDGILLKVRIYKNGVYHSDGVL